MLDNQRRNKFFQITTNWDIIFWLQEKESHFHSYCNNQRQHLTSELCTQWHNLPSREAPHSTDSNSFNVFSTESIYKARKLLPFFFTYLRRPLWLKYVGTHSEAKLPETPPDLHKATAPSTQDDSKVPYVTLMWSYTDFRDTKCLDEFLMIATKCLFFTFTNLFCICLAFFFFLILVFLTKFSLVFFWLISGHSPNPTSTW